MQFKERRLAARGATRMIEPMIEIKYHFDIRAFAPTMGMEGAIERWCPEPASAAALSWSLSFARMKVEAVGRLRNWA
jgi:hypothetical protein